LNTRLSYLSILLVNQFNELQTQELTMEYVGGRSESFKENERAFPKMFSLQKNSRLSPEDPTVKFIEYLEKETFILFETFKTFQ
jgi:hypothetical protein